MFDSIDFDNFWDDDEYALENYVSEAPTDELIRQVEAALGYKLPESYIYLMKRHNGGMPKKTFCPCDDKSFPDMIEGIYGIGGDKPCSLLGEFRTEFWVEEWGYPPIGIAICDTPSAGHDMIFLDYSECGRNGEPRVACVEQEADYQVRVLAENFEAFISKLRTEDELGLS